MNKYKSILLLTTIILFIIIRYILDFNGLYGQDAYEYLRYTKALHVYFKTGIQPGDFFWPLYYPIAGAFLSFLIESEIALQIITIACLSISTYYVIKLIHLLYPTKFNPFIYVLIFFTLSPMVFRLGIITMSDMLSTTCILLSFYNAITYYRNKTIKHLFFLVGFSVSAIMTRYVAFVVLLPLGLYTLHSIVKEKKALKYIPLLLILMLFLLLPHFIIRTENTTQFLKHDWLTQWSFLNFFKSSFTTADGISKNSLLNILYAFSSLFHPRYIFIGIILFPSYLKTKTFTSETILIIISILLYNFFLAGIPFQNSRFLLLSFPLLIVILYPAFSHLIDKIESHKKKFYIILILFLIQIVLCMLSLKPIFERNRLEKDIALQLKEYQKNTLYSFDIDIALEGQGLNFKYKNLWLKKYTSFKTNALVLFHPSRFKPQWEGQNPILNWNKLNQDYDLRIIKKLPDGWILYKIQEKKSQYDLDKG